MRGFAVLNRRPTRKRSTGRMTTDRRTFLSQAAASMAAFTVAGDLQAAPQQGPAGASRALDAPLLAALGEAMLPETLGAAGRTRAGGGFRDWVGAHAPG